MGVKDESSNKTNGVGKSLSIEFLHFALLSNLSKSRVSLIPSDIFPPDTEVCLDFEVDGKNYTLRRSPNNSDEPKLICNGKQTTFSSIADASAYLRKRLFSHSEMQAPSFRAMLGPLMRDERSEFKSIVGCYDTSLRIPDNYTPHLFLFGLDVEVYSSIRAAITEIDELTKDIRKIKDNVKLLRQKDISDARSDLNELESEVEEIERSIDALENVSGYEFVKDDLIRLETNLDELRRKKSLLSQKLARTKIIAEAEKIDAQEIGEFFEQINERLGDLIKKDLEQVYAFKAKIDEFQNQLIHERRNVISEEITNLTREINVIDRQYTEKLKILDQQGNLKSLKQTYAAFKEKADEASQLKAFISRFEDLETQKQKARTRKEADLLQFQSDIQACKETLASFEHSILDIHEYIQGNKKASFEIKPTSKKQVVEIVMRIDDDGSHSVEREKVFIYDIALLLNEHTASRHPGVLVHDNIFDVDQDTLIRSIKFLFEKAEFAKQQQYILTLNSDRLESDIRALIMPAVRAEYTKQKRFLKAHYQEERK
ncbi:DUF2326 domain-containing protein [Sphingorhabdus lutea]|uniref:DUF2326 domain-containing protein n=1 Tax=Sphingorhabdus lutea TaxID=1913578 RepID=UPI0018DE2217|nr:DUF2326 domain-containing protein [Sphingorhabdus lutea]